jgi:hypothetical protein
MSHPPFYFFHEYLDEAGRMRVFKNTAETETEARKNNRRAADFAWVTQHQKPTVSPLFARDTDRDKPIAPAQRPGTPYHTHSQPTTMPEDVRQLLANYKVPSP